MATPRCVSARIAAPSPTSGRHAAVANAKNVIRPLSIVATKASDRQEIRAKPRKIDDELKPRAQHTAATSDSQRRTLTCRDNWISNVAISGNARCSITALPCQMRIKKCPRRRKEVPRAPPQAAAQRDKQGPQPTQHPGKRGKTAAEPQKRPAQQAEQGERPHEPQGKPQRPTEAVSAVQPAHPPVTGKNKQPLTAANRASCCKVHCAKTGCVSRRRERYQASPAYKAALAMSS